jgi:5-methylcytosine-specific restriction endonuclease McrA
MAKHEYKNKALAHYEGRFKKKKKKNYRRRLTGEEHQLLKMAAYEMSDGICQSSIHDSNICTGKPFISYAEATLDHIIPLSSGGTDDLLNLRILCRICHGLRYGKEHEQERQRMIERGEMPDGWERYIWKD